MKREFSFLFTSNLLKQNDINDKKEAHRKG